MADGERLGASFSIDVTNLKAGLTEANRLIRESESEFKAAAAGMDDWSNSQDGLSAKIKSLTDITDIQKKKVGALQDEYDNLIKNGLDPTSKQAVELRTKINNEQAALAKNEKELRNQKDALNDLENGSDKAGDEVEDLGDESEKTSRKLEGLKKVGGVAVKAIAAIGAAAVSAVGAFLSLGESTKETQVAMAKLENSFNTAGLGAKNATETMNALYSVLGDMDRSVEASNLLAKMSKNEADLETNTRILTGVFAEYGDSIPTEGLAEGMQATAQMGSVQGVLADALEWQGINLDEYNEKLASMSSAEERAAYIQKTLIDLYGESADTYRENNKALIESNEAQLNLEKTLADIGKVAMPIMTQLKKIATELLQTIKPFVELIGEGLTGALNGTEGSVEKLAEGVGGVLTTAVEKISEMLPTIIEVVTAILPAVLDAITNAIPSLVDAVTTAIPQIVSAIAGMLPSVVKLITGLIPQLLQAILQSVPPLIQAAVDVVAQLLPAISGMLPEIVTTILEFIPQLIDALTEAIPTLLDGAFTFLMAIVDAVPQIIAELMGVIPDIVSAIVEFLTTNVPVILEGAIQLLMAIVDAIPQIITALTGELPNIVSSIIETLTANIPTLLDGAVQFLTAIIDAIPLIIVTLTDEMPNIISTIVDILIKNVPTLLKAAVTLFTAIVDAIPKVTVSIVKAMPKMLASMVETVINSVGSMKDAGIQLIKGLWEGIKSVKDWVIEKIQGFSDDVLEGIKDFFGIHSPSRVMRDMVGKNLALGIGEGFEENIGEVNKQITDAMNFDDASINVDANGIGGRKSNGVTIYQTNNYSQAHSRLELYKSKQETAAAVRLALGGAV